MCLHDPNQIQINPVEPNKKPMISALNRTMFNKVITEHRGEGMRAVSNSLILLWDRAGYPHGGHAGGCQVT